MSSIRPLRRLNTEAEIFIRRKTSLIGHPLPRPFSLASLRSDLCVAVIHLQCPPHPALSPDALLSHFAGARTSGTLSHGCIVYFVSNSLRRLTPTHLIIPDANSGSNSTIAPVAESCALARCKTERMRTAASQIDASPNARPGHALRTQDTWSTHCSCEDKRRDVPPPKAECELAWIALWITSKEPLWVECPWISVAFWITRHGPAEG